MIDLRKRNLLTLLDFSADEITYMLDLAARRPMIRAHR